jgi:hypothetical protein
MWKEYSVEKPTNEEHEYLVKEVKTSGMSKGSIFFHVLEYSNNLSEVDSFDFWGRTDGGFYDCDTAQGYYSIDENKFKKLYWVDLTELNFELSINDLQNKNKDDE